jgi:hypothetical protein
MKIFLRHGVETEQAEKVIRRYYNEMGGGTRAYDEGKGVESNDDQFTREQLIAARKLVNKLGGRGIPSRAIDDLCARQSRIAKKLAEVPSTITIRDETENIPWMSISELFDAFRVPYVTTARYTKVLHKKRPNLIPILDSRVRDDYFLPTIARWQGKPFPISILRIFDILIWCRFGPFRERFADLYTSTP